MGALRRTIYVARYLADETYGRKIARQLNRGENLHALRRDLLYAHEGAIRRRRVEQQTEQACNGSAYRALPARVAP